MNGNDKHIDDQLRGVRLKPTDIENVLPPVAELIVDKLPVLKYVDLDGVQQSMDYRELAARDPYPIPMPVDREGYGSVDNSHHFWGTGQGDLLNVMAAVQRFGDGGENRRLFDFGCATGRFLRHVLLFSPWESWGSDFAPANIAWIKRHLPLDNRVSLNTNQPALDFPDATFDVVTAFSVFTHIDTDSLAWLRELCRLTRPGGLLYVTIQNQATWDRVLERPGSLEHLQKANQIAGNLHVDAALFRHPMPEPRIVFQMSQDDVYNCNVWERNDYVYDHWSAFAEILHIADNAHTGFQSVVILRPKT